MEPNEIQTALEAAVEEVLETMCFTGVVASSEGTVPAEGDGGGPAIAAALRFDGSPSGEFRMSVPLKLARAVGSSFLGREEEEVSDSQAEEVVCELANIICGSVLSRLQSESSFRLSHPELVRPEADLASGRAAASRWFDLEGGILAASLELQRTA